MLNIKELEEETIQRYAQRYKNFARTSQTLGRGSEFQQEYRFLQVVKNVDFTNKSVLDIGCGFGDLFSFFKNKQVKVSHYCGLDISEDLLNEGKTTHPDGEFILGNFLEKEEVLGDVGVMLGVLNENLQGRVEHFEYSKNAIKQAFSLVRETLVVDFLSANLTPNYPKDDSAYYHSPMKTLNFALKLTGNARIIHNYKPIPQKEFLLILEK